MSAGAIFDIRCNYSIANGKIQTEGVLTFDASATDTTEGIMRCGPFEGCENIDVILSEATES